MSATEATWERLEDGGLRVKVTETHFIDVVPMIYNWRIVKQERVDRVLGLMRGVDWRCLGTTKAGAPKHPLYIKGDQPLVPFAS